MHSPEKFRNTDGSPAVLFQGIAQPGYELLIHLFTGPIHGVVNFWKAKRGGDRTYAIKNVYS